MQEQLVLQCGQVVCWENYHESHTFLIHSKQLSFAQMVAKPKAETEINLAFEIIKRFMLNLTEH